MPAAVQPAACILYTNESSSRETLSNSEKKSDSTLRLSFPNITKIHEYKNKFYDYDVITAINTRCPLL